MATIELIGPMPRYSYRGKVFNRSQVQRNVSPDIAKYLKGTGYFRVGDDSSGVTIAVAEKPAGPPDKVAQFKTKKAAMGWAMRTKDVTIPKGWSLVKMNKATARLEAGLELNLDWDKDVPSELADDPPEAEPKGEEV